jgi:hypothetical protein
MRIVLLLVSVTLVSGCEALKEPLAGINLLPAVQGAQRLLAEVSAARLEVDPTVSDPFTALGSCVDTVTACYLPGVRDLSVCLASTDTCKTDAPWAEPTCCPAACKTALADRLAAGEEQLQALEGAFFGSPSCFPGVQQALETK